MKYNILTHTLFSIIISLMLLFGAVQPQPVSAASSPIQGSNSWIIHADSQPQTGKLTFLGAESTAPIRVSTMTRDRHSPQTHVSTVTDRFESESGMREPVVPAIAAINFQYDPPAAPSRYVDGTTGVDAGDCSSVSTPCASIQYAIMKAVAGETIAVTRGTYTFVNVPGSGNEEYEGQTSPRKVVLVDRRVNLSGGWDSAFINQDGITMVDGEHERHGIMISISPGDTSDVDHFAIWNALGTGIFVWNGTLVFRNGSIYNTEGDGIWTYAASVVAENSTINGNSRYGIRNNGSALFTNTTISNNGDAGIYHFSGSFTIQNTILAGNAIGTSDCDGTILSGGHNILGNSAGCTISPTSGDQFNVNPQLGTFLPSHGYQPLHAASPAIGNGDSALCPAVDQRGLARSGICDIGAYEYYAPGAAASIWGEVGGNQRTRIDADYPKPLTASVLDGQGSPVSGVDVTFSAPGSGPSGVFAATVTNIEGPIATNEDGIATTSTLTANSEIGLFAVQAGSSVGTADFSLENLAWKLYVTETGSDSNSCITPASPCATINGAIGKANEEDVIYIAKGTYVGSGFQAILIEKSITLSGGWDNTFTQQVGLSTIDGEHERRGIEISGPITVILSHLEIKNAKGIGVKNYQAALTISQSSIHDNVYDGGSGGGVHSVSGTLNISNSTISNNYSQSGGGIYSSSVTELSFVTVTNNQAQYGGGLYKYDSGVPFTVKNSIIAQNTASESGPDCQLYPSGAAVSQGYNIVQTTCGPAQPTDQFNTDPKLGTFLPAQGYHPILAGSPAIDRSDNACNSVDQRDVARVDISSAGMAGVTCDAGAYEYIRNNGTPASVWAVTGNNQRTPPGTNFPSPLTAVVLDDQGNPVAGANVIFSAPTSGPGTIFTGSGTGVEGPIHTGLDGAATTSVVTANSTAGAYFIHVNAGVGGTADFSLENIVWYVAPDGNDANSCQDSASPCATINGALAKIEGGDTIYVKEGVYTSIATEVVLISKSVCLSGGWNDGFTLVIGYSTIDGENLHRGVYVEKAYTNTPIAVALNHFILKNGNSLTGGNIYNNAEALTITDSIVEEGYAGSGGGIISLGGSLMLDKVIVRNNEATNGSGGIETNSNSTITNSIIVNNVSASRGGGLATSGTLNMTNTTITGNTGLDGGGVYIGSTILGSPTFNNVTIVGNYATEYGGGIYYNRSYPPPPDPVLNNSIVAGNEAESISQDCGGYFVGNYSIIGNSAGCFGFSGGTNLVDTDPQLLPYLFTEGYYPPRLGSPAINGGNPAAPGSGGTACAATDQRGLPRNDARCDIGAFERKTPGAAVKIAPITHDWRTPPNTAFRQPLQAAVLDAEGNPVGAGLPLTFTAPPAGGPSGRFASGSNENVAATDASGVASTATFTANGHLGSYTVNVTGAGLTAVELSLSNFAWYVKTDGDDSNSCQTPDSACRSINAAIGKARPLDTVYVAEGVYKHSGSPEEFSVVTVTQRVTVMGGWNPSFTAPGQRSIIDGEYNHEGIYVYRSSTLARLFVTNGTLGVINNGNSVTLDQMAIMGNSETGVSNHDRKTLTILNSTIGKNQTRGLANGYESTMVIRNSTIVENSALALASGPGGIQNSGGTVTLSNSILALNLSPSSMPNCYGQIKSNGNNIIGSLDGCSFTSAAGDQINIDPQISPLLPGGYYPLKSTSPALNAGNAATCTSWDQRGIARLDDGACDIGAYEHATPGVAVELIAINPGTRRALLNSPFREPLTTAALDALGTPVSGVTVNLAAPANGPSGTFLSIGGTSESLTTDANGFATSSTFTANGTYGDYDIQATSPGISAPVAFLLHNGAWFVAPSGSNANDCLLPSTPCASIPGVMDKPEFNAGEVIWIAEGTYAGSNYDIEKDVTLLGSWNPTFTGSGQATVLTSFYHINGFVNVLMRSVVISGNGSLGSNGNLTLENSSVDRSTNGVSSRLGNLTLINVTISGHVGNGPALKITSGNALIENSTITGNSGTLTGGIVNESGTVTLQNTIVAGNIATQPQDYASADCDGVIDSLGFNIVGTIGTKYAIACVFRAERYDVYGSDEEPVNVLDVLDVTPVRDPLTGQIYHPIIVGGLAVDKVRKGICPLTDQLGEIRPQGKFCDIGAYEVPYPLAAPKLSLPKNKALLANLKPTLDWKDVTGAHHYELQLATDPVFTQNVLGYDNILTSNYTLPTDLNLATTYYWHVRSCNLHDNCGAWSKSSSFRTAFPAPTGGAPNGITVGSRKPTFTWSVIIGATGYRIQISTTDTFATTLVNATSSTTSYVPRSDLPAGTTLYWRVQTNRGPFAPGFWSDVWSFITP